MSRYLYFIIFIILSAFSMHIPSKIDNAAYSYVDQYKALAVVEMYRCGIPASITLAQALHESGVGSSDLAIHANNHFGIKCKSYWNGKTYNHVDDDYDDDGNLIKSCFRAYDLVLDSYIDHSNFLKQSVRYEELFSIDKRDYKSWAHGLKRCGYATDNNYAKKLINNIEKYQLYLYDQENNPLLK